MKLIQFGEPGPAGVMQCLEVPIPEPKPGEVLIRAAAIGVGMPDVAIRRGTYSHMPPLPATPASSVNGSCRGRASTESPTQIESKPAASARAASARSGAASGLPSMICSRVGNR